MILGAGLRVSKTHSRPALATNRLCAVRLSVSLSGPQFPHLYNEEVGPNALSPSKVPFGSPSP